MQVSQLFQDCFGDLYDPVKCWTSSLRSRCGLPEFENRSLNLSSFTLQGSDLSNAIWKLLLQSSFRHVEAFSREDYEIDPVYHFEVFMTEGDSTDWFSMETKQLEMVCKPGNLFHFWFRLFQHSYKLCEMLRTIR